VREIPDKAPTVMVVDDNDEVRLLLTQFLWSSGYRVIAAESAFEAERLALESIPQLILMDIGMPHVDGLSTIWRMRDHAELANVPVVIISACDSYDLRAEAAGAGCKGYLQKPVETEELKALMEQVLHDHPADRNLAKATDSQS
jgi:DNA-binding response OmpR family regulator